MSVTEALTPASARLVAAAAAAALLLTGLGATDFWAPDEPRYGAIAEELRQQRNGAVDWIVLRLNGKTYSQKPPLYFWLAALAGAPAHRVSEVAARLPSALAGVAVVWLAIGFGSRRLGPWTGVAAGIILLTAWEFAFLARRAQLDVLLTLWITLALVWFWRCQREPKDKRGPVIVHVAMGLAVLTKGPVGWLLPALIILAYLAWEGRLRELPGWFRPSALVWSLGPGLIWFAAATAVAPPGYFEAAVVENLFGRFFAGTSHARPAYYYLYQFPILFLPWTPLWILAASVGRKRVFANDAEPERARVWRFLLCWVGVPLLFFSLAGGKRGVYMLPAFPATALLCADAVSDWLARRDAIPRSVSTALFALAAAVAIGGILAPWIGESWGVEIPWLVGFGTALIAAGAVFSWHLARRASAPTALQIGLIGCAVFFTEWLCFSGYLPALNIEKSPRPIAEAAAELTHGAELVGLVSERALVGGITYYGNRQVAELSDPDSIARFLQNGGRVLVVAERKLERVESVASAQIQARARSGRRTLLVVTAEGADGD